MHESFDFNSSIKNDKNQSILKNYLKSTTDKLISDIYPLFKLLKIVYRNGNDFAPDIKIENDRVKVFDKNNFLLVDFTFDGICINEMNVHNTAYTSFINGEYVQVVSIIFYVVTHMPYKIINLNFVYDRPSITYKIEGMRGYKELEELDQISEEYVNKLPEHITFNSKYVLLDELRFIDDAAIKAFIYKLRKDNPDTLKITVKHCQYTSELPYFMANMRGRNKGETSKLIKKYIKAPLNSLLEGFNFDQIDTTRPNMNDNIQVKKYMLDSYIVELAHKKIIDSIYYNNKHFSSIWNPPRELAFDTIYYNIEISGNELILHLDTIHFVFSDIDTYNEVCNKLSYFKNIRIDGKMYIGFALKGSRKQRLENFGNLNESITYVNALELHNFILHDFNGMPETKNLVSNDCQIITFDGFNYKDYVNNVLLYYKPNTYCPYNWSGFPKKIARMFEYVIEYVDDSYYQSVFLKQFTTLRGFPTDFTLLYDTENMKSAQCHFLNINMQKWQRDKIREHIMDLLLQEVPNAKKRERLFKILSKMYRYR